MELSELIAHYADAWSQPDRARRQQLLESVWDEQGTYADPFGLVARQNGACRPHGGVHSAISGVTSRAYQRDRRARSLLSLQLAHVERRWNALCRRDRLRRASLPPVNCNAWSASSERWKRRVGCDESCNRCAPPDSSSRRQSVLLCVLSRASDRFSANVSTVVVRMRLGW